MARHNREGSGTDQRGFEYRVNYQPDWLRHVKVTRSLPSGRQSTMTLFRNPLEAPEQAPGDRVRTRITCEAQGVDVEVSLRANGGEASRATVSCYVPKVDGKGEEEITFILENGLGR